MFKNLRELIIKYKEFIAYAVFGVLTTLVNVVMYSVSTRLLCLGVMPSTIIAWLVAVAFAYVTNRKWVFKSKADTKKEVVKEAFNFFLCRLTTGVLDWAWMLLFVDILQLNDVLMKLIANIIVIIFNYIASKLFIFKRK